MLPGAPPTRRHDVVLSWLLARAVDARARNTVEFGAGTESVLVSGICELRRSTAACSEGPLAGPKLGSCASAGGEAGPVSAQPLPQVLEPTSSKVADSTAFGRPGMASVAEELVSRMPMACAQHVYHTVSIPCRQRTPGMGKAATLGRSRPAGLATWPAHRQSGLVRTPERSCCLMTLATLCGATPALPPPACSRPLERGDVCVFNRQVRPPRPPARRLVSGQHTLCAVPALRHDDGACGRAPRALLPRVARALQELPRPVWQRGIRRAG